MAGTHQPCPDCGSSDALQINDDGSTYCHSCQKFTPIKKTKKHSNDVLSLSLAGEIKSLSARALSLETCKKFGYEQGKYNGKSVQVAKYYDYNGNLKFAKTRDKDKNFQIIGKFEPLLYGQQLFKGSQKKLIITEGEIDCLSVYQMNGGNPVVSIPNGAASAAKAIKHNLKWLEQFEEIIFMFDNDEPGIEAAKECVQLISVGKGKIASLPLKDANEMLLAGRKSELIDAIFRASVYRPDGIVFGEELWEEVNKEIEWGYDYPFPTMTKLTYGIRVPEIYAFGAGTGIGKTTIIKEFQYDLAIKQGFNIGCIHLEDVAKKVTMDFMSKYLNKQIHKPDVFVSDEERKEAFDKTLGTGKIFIYDSKGERDPETIYRKIREMVKAYDCKFIFLDHIKAILDYIGAKDPVETANNIVSKLSRLSLELDCTIFIITHLRKSQGKPFEEGGRITLDDYYGSGALKQYANYCWGIERNKNDEDKEKRHITRLRCLKDRYTGEADGEVITIKFNQDTGRLVEVDDIEETVELEEGEQF